MVNTPLLTRFANPGRFLRLARILRPVAGIACLLFLIPGLYLSFFSSPADYQQGETVRIMYVHVPAAWMALFVYVTMAAAAFTGLVWKHVLAEIYPKAVAPLGAVFTLICLVTGSLWGKPMWGTWWVWDARLTSMFVLLLLYAGYMALVDAFDDRQRGLNAGAWLLLAGLVNIPVIKFSVDWWNTLHQPAGIIRLGAPAVDAGMLVPLLVMAGFFKMFYVLVALLRMETEISARRAAAEGRDA